ncbi:MAG: transcription termination factor Rho [Clostridiales bacterium]|nr:transcription termination factor Rho [Clostridiales bacterium]
MSEFDQLIAKSKSDLEAIAVQFGDFSAEDAATKTKEELIASIAGVSVDEVLKMTTPEKAPAKSKKTAASRTRKSAKKEEKEKAEDKTSSPEPEEKKEEAPSADEGKKKTPARGRKKRTETEDASPAPEEKETEKAEEPVAESKPEAPAKKRGRKKKSDETAPAEVKEEEKKSGDEAQTEPSADAVSQPAETEQAKPSGKKNSKKRRISFGPEQETKQIEITDEEADASSGESGANNEDQAAPEIQYKEIEGILSIGGNDGKNEYCGFVHRFNYLPGEDDAYVPGQLIKRMGLRRGDKIKGLVAPPRGKDKYAPLRRILAVNDIEIPEDSDFEIIRKRPRFESLTAIYPDQRLTLETGNEDLSARIIDLFSPIGKGQRGMIVSPPKAGKTILLKKVANSITANNPDCKVIVLLIDERPEEVTDMQRSIRGEVVYSTFDKRPENHVRVTELVLERAMRLVELGQDVVILLDSMTRLARAYNLTINPTGRTLSGGLDPGSLYGPKRFFGAARNIEFGGSLTIIATALIETGSRMDEVIFEEFKGTGNMEVVLDRKLADRRVFPAIAVDKSGTRREDLLLSEEELEAVWLTRKAIAEVDTIAATEAVINYMRRTQSNASFVLSAKKSFSVDK